MHNFFLTSSSIFVAHGGVCWVPHFPCMIPGATIVGTCFEPVDLRFNLNGLNRLSTSAVLKLVCAIDIHTIAV